MNWFIVTCKQTPKKPHLRKVRGQWVCTGHDGKTGVGAHPRQAYGGLMARSGYYK